MPHTFKPAGVLPILVLLTACGGGDGDPGTKGPNLSGNPGGGGGGGLLEVEGLWTGQSNDGVQTALIVLEDGSAWGLQRRGSVLASAIVGKASSSGGVFTLPASVFNLRDWSPANSTYAGTYTARSSIAATSTGNSPLALSYKSAYESAATVSAVAGSYTLNGMSKTAPAPRVTMAISASGAIGFSNWGTCSPTGTVSARSSGRNVFNLSISFKGACPLAEGTLVNGMFFVDKSASPAQAYVLAQTATKDDGFFAATAN
jgi:hypothetical protein